MSILTMRGGGAGRCRGVRIYLGRDGFDLLAACAACSSLDWAFTQHLAAALNHGIGSRYAESLRRSRPEIEVDIARVIGLPWLRHGQMPRWLRARLVAELAANSPISFSIASRTLNDLVQAAEKDSDTRLARLLGPPSGGPRTAALAMLVRWWLRRTEPHESPLRDRLYLEVLRRRAPAPEEYRLRVAMRERVRRAVFQIGTVIVRPSELSSRLRGVVLTAVALLVGALLFGLKEVLTTAIFVAVIGAAMAPIAINRSRRNVTNYLSRKGRRHSHRKRRR